MAIPTAAIRKIMKEFFRHYPVRLAYHVRYEGLDDVVLCVYDHERDVYHRTVLTEQEKLAAQGDIFATSFGRALSRLKTIMDEFYSGGGKFICSVTQRRCVCHGGPCVHVS